MISRKKIAGVVVLQVAALVVGGVFAGIGAGAGLSIAIGAAIVIGTAGAGVFSFQIARYARAALEEAKQARRQTYQLQHLIQLQQLLCPRRPLPQFGKWALSADLALLLVQLIRERSPGLTLELGSGVSTLVLAYALEQQETGRLVSVEHDADFARQTVATIKAHGLEGVLDCRVGALQPTRIGDRTYLWYARESWMSIPDRSVELLLVDGPPRRTGQDSRFPALSLLHDKLAPEAIIVLDDCDDREMRDMIDAWCGANPDLCAERFDSLDKTPIILYLNEERNR
jgi:predicted O-methyltransferase YrrM